MTEILVLATKSWSWSLALKSLLTSPPIEEYHWYHEQSDLVQSIHLVLIDGAT